MRRKRGGQESLDSGQDSFLDIVANLVGILIILVMVIGVRAKDALVEAAIASTHTENANPDAETSNGVAEQVQMDIYDVQTKLEDVQAESHLQNAYRHQLATLISAARHDLNEVQGKLDTSTQQRVALVHEFSEAEQQLKDLTNAESALQRSLNHPLPLEHLPTPLAKTVFGKETHFQLKGGRIVYVPLNEFVEQLSNEWEQKVWKLKEAKEVVEMVGPIQGFRMQYTIAKKMAAVKTSAGMQRREMVHVAGFVLLPVRENMGQTVAEALQPDSSFFQRVAGFDPQRTTITLWTYPDSFAEFRQVREELHRLGYNSAGRPLPDGYPIGGSPNGSRSAAQ